MRKLIYLIATACLLSGIDNVAKSQGYCPPTISCTSAAITNVTLNGYSDWYLPSMDELNNLYINKNVIGGFGNFGYWSSSEYSSINAWQQSFITGSQSNQAKNNPFQVRAVRAF